MALSPIYCSGCGTLLSPEAKFCAKCGRLTQASAALAQVSAQSAIGTGLLPEDSLLNKRYRIRQRVGTGGMGAVYKAEDTPYGDRLVAVKEMRQSGLTQQELDATAQQFKHEAIMLANLQHPSLPRVYDHFLETNRWYLVMDYIDGDTLYERLQMAPGHKLPPLEVIDIGIQLCKVLDYLHKRQPPVIFRDIKPANIMLTSEGHLYLIDFGIARIFKPGQARDTKAYGSIGYAAPEQFDIEQTTSQADVYSLGVTMHEMFSGSNPALTPFHLPPLNSSDQPALSRLATLINRMLAMEKKHRPASMAAIRQELESIRDELRQSKQSTQSAQSAPAFAPPTQYAPQPQPAMLPPTQYVSPPAPVRQQQVRVSSAASKEKRNVWTVGKGQLIAVVVGVVIYAIVSALFGFFDLNAQASFNPAILNPIFSGLQGGPLWIDTLLGLGLVIPCFFGARFGPWVGAVVAVVGTLIGDLISRFLPYGYWFAGMAALGFIAGLAFTAARGRYNKASNLLLAVVLSLVGILVWNLIRVFGDFTTQSISFGSFLPALLATTLVQLVSLVPLLILLLIANVAAKPATSIGG